MNLNSRYVALAIGLLIIGLVFYFFRDIVAYVLLASP